MKRLLFLSLLLCLPLVSAGAQSAASLKETRPSARAWMVMEEGSGTLIRYNRSTEKRAIASTTKLLTALAVMKNGDLDRWVTVSAKSAAQQPSKIGLRKGERWKRRDLLKALLIKSANDSAVALAESVSGSEAAFCRKLDAIAKGLGCKSTHILRASGLPASGQYCTAADLAIITKAVFKNSYISTLLSWKSASIRSSGGRRLSLSSRNRYLRVSSGKVKGKTGYTRRAQRCFAGRIELGTKKYIVVFLGSANLWADLGKLRTWTIRFEAARHSNNSKLSAAKKKKWQAYLNRKGYSAGTVDGAWGVKTQNAFLKFQDAKKLGRDGLVGPQAWRAMK